MKKPLTTLLFFFLMLSTSEAAIIESVKTVITGVNSYAEYNGGDIVVYVQDPPVECSGGFWIEGTNLNPGQKNTMSVILSAFHTGSFVYVTGYDNAELKWPGSGNFTCKLYNVRLTK